MECVICYNENNSKFTTTKCNHNFHTACLERWLSIKPTCPICRFEFENKDGLVDKLINILIFVKCVIVCLFLLYETDLKVFILFCSGMMSVYIISQIYEMDVELRQNIIRHILEDNRF